MKHVWLIETKERWDGPWYPCWYEVYYSKPESMEALKNLKEENGSFYYGHYKTAKYKRAK